MKEYITWWLIVIRCIYTGLEHSLSLSQLTYCAVLAPPRDPAPTYDMVQSSLFLPFPVPPVFSSLLSELKSPTLSAAARSPVNSGSSVPAI